MLKFAPYILKNLWRQRVRTVLAVGGTAVATFVFSMVAAVQDGLERLTSDRRTERTLIVFQANRFCPATSKLPEDYARQIAGLPGVERATPIKVFTNNCRASLDVVVFNGMPPEHLRLTRSLNLLDGDWASFMNGADAALVGAGIARRRNLKVGQRYSIGEINVAVAGIFRSATPGEENLVYAHLDFLQRTKGLHSVGTVTQIEVKLNSGADIQKACQMIDALFRDGPVASNTRPRGVFQASAVGDLAELIRMTRYLGFASVGLIFGLIATTTIMSVQDRIREHAVLRTMGYSGPLIVGLIVAESVVVSLGGGELGVGLALAVLSSAKLAVGAEGVLIAFVPSWALFENATAAALAVGAIAGFVPAMRTATADIAPALRAV